MCCHPWVLTSWNHRSGVCAIMLVLRMLLISDHSGVFSFEFWTRDAQLGAEFHSRNTSQAQSTSKNHGGSGHTHISCLWLSTWQGLKPGIKGDPLSPCDQRPESRRNTSSCRTWRKQMFPRTWGRYTVPSTSADWTGTVLATSASAARPPDLVRGRKRTGPSMRGCRNTVIRSFGFPCPSSYSKNNVLQPLLRNFCYVILKNSPVLLR